MKLPPLPPLGKELILVYRQLIKDIDQAMAEMVETLPPQQLQCSPGCSNCCIEFSVFTVEAAYILSQIRSDHIFCLEIKNSRCSFLQSDLCQIYAARPVICRTQGLPLAYTDEETQSIQVSACHLNFPEDFPFSQDNVFFMDDFNDRLFSLNLSYCDQAGIDPLQRIPLSELFTVNREK